MTIRDGDAQTRQVTRDFLRELMDDPCCDLAALRRTYARFDVVNSLVAGWAATYRRRIRPLAVPGRPLTLLDVGSGGGAGSGARGPGTPTCTSGPSTSP